MPLKRRLAVLICTFSFLSSLFYDSHYLDEREYLICIVQRFEPRGRRFKLSCIMIIIIIIINHHTMFGCKWLSGSGDIAWTKSGHT